MNKNDDEFNENEEDFSYGYYDKPNNYRPPEKKKKSRAGTVAFALIFSMIGALIGGAFGSRFYLNKYTNQLGNLNTGQDVVIEVNDDNNVVKAVSKKAIDSVVGISSTTTIKNFLYGPSEVSGIGSGVIIDQRGYILTNDHVIASLAGKSSYSNGENYADDITVITNDSTQLQAEVVWSDSNLDLAILKVESEKPLKAATLGDSDALELGDWAIAIGNPLALEFHGTVTAGFISGLNRSLPVEGGNLSMSNLIQTSAAINGGNSGGPLLNAKGEVVGINTLKIQSGEGLGFSIAINTVKPIIEQVLKTGTFERVTMGFEGVDIGVYENFFNIDTGLDSGVVIFQIVPNSPAQKGGLKSNDIILKLNDLEIDSMQTIQRELYKYNFGDKVNLEIMRDGEIQNIEITFEKIN